VISKRFALILACLKEAIQWNRYANREFPVCGSGINSHWVSLIRCAKPLGTLRAGTKQASIPIRVRNAAMARKVIVTEYAPLGAAQSANGAASGVSGGTLFDIV
jgi:hypothetical protein